ncbi:hypothetical protein AMK59_7343 [Oryctes borbonicus]|uniref:CHK kinase-like domain-containing protein n=1 Tax=Oryctes borbonicus TaxID=1629725 RepID=A0A0T6ATD5_9SCAR|nr:hypothetical protein AMK59_7343 [Oryctes borbonicus]
MVKPQFNEINVRDEIKHLVGELAAKHGFSEGAEIKYFIGSQVGDGYGAETIAVAVEKDGKSLNLFLKCAKYTNDTRRVETDKIYANEIYFYKTVYPAYRDFLNEKGIRDGFYNAPKYYGAQRDRFKEVIFLENLRSKGYTLFNRFKFMNDAHLTLVLKIFAKFHAISFAFKDQRHEFHEKMCSNCYDVNITMEAMGFYKMLGDMTRDFFAKLDPVEDKDILDRSGNIVEKTIDCVRNSAKRHDAYSILTKGDCWSNNMMLLYEDELEENPIDIMLVDWQLIRKASPVHDLMNLFFSVISKESLENTERYLKIYHEELSRQIRQMGSDPQKLYPYEVFEADWRKLSLYGYGVAVLLIKMMLSEVEESPNFEGMKNGTEFENVEEFMPNIKKENEYMRRMKYITRYLIKKEIL